MKPPVIEYRKTSGQELMATWSLRQVLGVSVVLAGLVGLGMQGCTTERQMDAVTGSGRVRTTGPLAIPLGTRVDVSPQRLRKMGVTWVADWRHMSDERFSLLDMSRGCASAPEIFSMRDEMEAFVGASTDQEVRDFVKVMQAGTPAEQRAAVEAAGEKGFRAMGVGR